MQPPPIEKMKRKEKAVPKPLLRPWETEGLLPEIMQFQPQKPRQAQAQPQLQKQIQEQTELSKQILGIPHIPERKEKKKGKRKAKKTVKPKFVYYEILYPVATASEVARWVFGNSKNRKA